MLLERGKRRGPSRYRLDSESHRAVSHSDRVEVDMIRGLNISPVVCLVITRDFGLTFTDERGHVLQHGPEILVLLEQISDQKSHQVHPLLFIPREHLHSGFQIAYLYISIKYDHGSWFRVRIATSSVNNTSRDAKRRTCFLNLNSLCAILFCALRTEALSRISTEAARETLYDLPSCTT
jgi:hypothetical protein